MKIVKTSKILKALAKDGWYLVHQVGTWGDELKSIEKQSGLKF